MAKTAERRASKTAAPVVESPPEAGPELRFALDAGAIEARGREAVTVIESRLCQASRDKAKPSKTGKRAGFADLRKLVRRHCQDDPEFLGPRLSVVETAFRLLLLAPKEPVSLSALHEQLSQLWMTSPWPRHVSVESLGRMLLHDTYYGIVETEGRDEKAGQGSAVPTG